MEDANQYIESGTKTSYLKVWKWD